MLERITDQVWGLTDTIAIGGGFVLPLRSTVLRLEDGSVALVSPLAPTEARRAALAEIGPVRYLLAPSKLHHLFIGAAAEAYPEAEVWVAPGLGEKVALPPIAGELGPSLGGPLGAALATELVAGVPSLNEVALFHRRSRTLVLTDLVFHVLAPEGFVTGLLLRLVGTHGRLAQSRLVSLAVRDRAAYRASLERILAFRPDVVVMAHGEPLTTDSTERLARALGCAPPGEVTSSR